ncbi:hypothetical protein BLOT_014846 [Blomia tropicalis]|nr:hypothetical protein BLOT_014846 [Blomia tropicalis]
MTTGRDTRPSTNKFVNVSRFTLSHNSYLGSSSKRNKEDRAEMPSWDGENMLIRAWKLSNEKESAG